MNELSMWHEESATFKENKVVVKLKEKDGSFKKSVIVPTVYYPLNGSYEVFHYKNTEQVQDEAFLELFDKVEYKIGHCYQNTKSLAETLQKAGYDAKPYVGWLFTGADQFPIHHCWVVLDGKSILDLSDDFTLMLAGPNGKNFDKAGSMEEQREVVASFMEFARSLPNKGRCYPVGTPTPFLLYVGCECNSEQGRLIYQKLIRQFPDHECQRNCDSNGYNAMQKVLKDKGLME